MLRQFLYLFIFLFLLISCNESKEIREIEILNYYNSATEFTSYSVTDKTGFTQVIFKKEGEDNFDNFNTKIPESLIDSISSITENKLEIDFKFKETKRLLYCGENHMVKNTYNNGKILKFKYPYANLKNPQFYPFQSLNRKIKKDSLNATRVNIGQFGKLQDKQKVLSIEAYKNDSIFNLKFLRKLK
jgi:hypothetical protein